MDHSTLHDWLTHTISHAHSTHMIISPYMIERLHTSPHVYFSHIPHSHRLAQTSYAFPIFCLRMVQKIKKTKKTK
jgi:hypothetical protein